MSNVPGGWAFLLLAGAAFRVTRLIGWDSITEPIRKAIVTKAVQVSRTAGGEPRRARKTTDRIIRRSKISQLIQCPWCLGWWVCVAWWGAWLVWPAGTLIAATPWALSALVGLGAKNLDP